MRNWNQRRLRIKIREVNCLLITYEELKPYLGAPSNEVNLCLLITYEELKPSATARINSLATCLLITYEELKHVWLVFDYNPGV